MKTMYALLIGINRYDSEALNPLSFASADVRAVHDRLVRQYGLHPENAILIADGGETGPPPNRIEILRALSRFRRAPMDENDTFLLMFSGHGFSRDGKTYLACRDSEPDSETMLRETAVSLGTVREFLSQFGAGQHVIVLDACRNAAFRESKGADYEKMTSAMTRDIVAAVRPARSDRVRTGHAKAVVSSCWEGQVAYEFPEAGHGWFCHNLLQELESPSTAEVPIIDLFKRVGDRMRQHAWRQLPLAADQSPHVVVEGEVPVLRRMARDEGSVAETNSSVMQPVTYSKPQIAIPPSVRTTPQLLSAPFSPADRVQARDAWSRWLGTPAQITNSIGMKLTLIPAGEFLMGSPEDEEDRRSDEHQHRVRITKPFYLGVYEVTQAEYVRVMGKNPSRFQGDTNPVERVSWDDATEFCSRLSTQEGMTYRLPTEAEWEYACRAGTTTPFHFGSELNGCEANCNGNYPYGTQTNGTYLGRTTMVGSDSNAFGLYDMHGNVWEWCQDWYTDNYYAISPTDDPHQTETASSRVIRGGSWGSSARLCRAARRGENEPGIRGHHLGFRVAAVPPGGPSREQVK